MRNGAGRLHIIYIRRGPPPGLVELYPLKSKRHERNDGAPPRGESENVSIPLFALQHEAARVQGTIIHTQYTHPNVTALVYRTGRFTVDPL